MTVHIDKDVPFPKFGGGKSKYPWHELGVGESFVHAGNLRAAQQATLYWSRQTGKTFKAIAVDDTVRVWRIA